MDVRPYEGGRFEVTTKTKKKFESMYFESRIKNLKNQHNMLKYLFS